MTTLEESLGDKDVKQYAVQRLAKLLRHPDDLIYRADDVRRKLAQEKFLIDAQLNTDVRRQFDDVQEGLELLYSTKEQITRVKTDMQKVDQLCHDAQSYLTNFDRIQKISMVNRNFARTDEFYRQFSEFHEQYTSVRHMLTDAQTNFDQADFNLLRLHYSLYKLEDFRNRAMGFSGASDADSQQTLAQMFGSLDALVAEFEEFLWHVANNMFELALRNRTNIIVQLLKVIEVEEAADRTQEREREGAGLARRQSLLGSASVKTLAQAPKTDRKVKQYKKKLLSLIHTFVSKRINEFFEQEVQDFEGISEATGLVVDELTFVSEAVAPGFPANYYIFDVYVEEYHQAVVANTNRLVTGDLDGGAILVLLRWVREYSSAMRRDLGIPREQLKPALLEGREDQLAQEYLDLVRNKVREWVVNLMRSETSTFINRQDAPHISDAGTYVLEGSIILFEIINQQIALVVESQRAKLLCDLMAECNKIFQDMSKQWKEVIDAEKQKQIKDENVIEGLVDYAMALGNDSLRC
ncbi:SNARE-binding exocyst subunit S6, partial [Linderina pennispora]